MRMIPLLMHCDCFRYFNANNYNNQYLVGTGI